MPVRNSLLGLDAVRVLQRRHLLVGHHPHPVAGHTVHVVAAVTFLRGHRRHRRVAPLAEPVLHLLDLRALRRLDLGGEIGDPRIDALFGEYDVAHLDRLLVMRDHVLGEHDVGVVVVAGGWTPRSPTSTWL